MKILVIANSYPSVRNPSGGIFVYNLIQQFVKLGNDITVISPVGIKGICKKTNQISYGEELATVYRPKYITASAINLFIFNTYRISELSQIEAVKRVVKKHSIEFDVVYAHFLSNSFIAVKAFLCYDKPIYSAVGEYNNIDIRKAYYPKKHYYKTLSKIDGFVAVSPQVKQKLTSYGVTGNKIIVRPNAVDFTLFYQRNKIDMRKKHGLPLYKKLVIFVGRFVENKGPLRFLEAVETLKNVGLIFVGSGEQKLSNEKILFIKAVKNDIVPELLSAADLFVLPTLHEGSCNAIIEAMSCGLPIVSSNIPEIHEQCNPSFSILVDPLNISAINKAIKEIINDNEKRLEMSNNALIHSKSFDLRERAQSIISFISS